MYGKLFSSMYEGTLYGQWQAIVTLQQLVILADADGVVDMTPPAIAARTSIPLDIIEAGLRQLSEADKYSRSDAEEGRRIVPIDPERPWGWLIVNYAKYRDMRSAEDRKAYMREYMRDKRKQEKLTDANSKQPLTLLANTDTDTDTDTEKRKTARKRAVFVKPEVDEVAAYCRERGNAVDAAAFVDFYTAKGWKVGREPMRDWRAAVRTWEKRDEKPSGNARGAVRFEDKLANLRRLAGEEAGGAGVDEARGDVRGAVLEGVFRRAE